MYDYRKSSTANAVCTHSMQVIIKSPTQIIKWYLKLESSRMYSLQSTIVVDAVVDEFLKYLHCYSHRCCHRRHRRHHFALCTVDHFYLLVRLRLTHHLINCCPNVWARLPQWWCEWMNKREIEWWEQIRTKWNVAEAMSVFIADSNSKIQEHFCTTRLLEEMYLFESFKRKILDNRQPKIRNKKKISNFSNASFDATFMEHQKSKFVAPTTKQSKIFWKVLFLFASQFSFKHERKVPLTQWTKCYFNLLTLKRSGQMLFDFVFYFFSCSSK